MFETTRRKALQALGIGGATAVAGCASAPEAGDGGGTAASTETDSAVTADAEVADTVAADPTDVPDPIDRDSPTTHDVTLTAKEVVAEIEPGKQFTFLTFEGQIPGPMIRVRRGDTVSFTMENVDGNAMPHNVDFHAVYGTGGGAEATTAAPGDDGSVEFRAEYPGAYIYHCAVPRLDYHISSGMFGMILVEPEEGLPEVDQELYFGQHEVYTAGSDGDGPLQFDQDAMVDERPNYVLFNGEKYAWSASRYGPIEVDRGDTVRVFMVCGGPNLSSNFHPIGNVWSRAWRDGALGSDPELDVQTMKVPPGSCMVAEMETPVPERVKFVDHALSRVRHKGTLAEMDVLGEEQPEIFDPEPGEGGSGSGDGSGY